MIKYSIKVGLKPRAGSDLHPVRLRVSWCGLRCDIAAGVSWDPKKWLSDAGRCKQNTKNSLQQSAADVNRYIEEAVAFISDIFARASVAGSVPGVDDLKESFAKAFGKKSAVHEKTILDVYAEFVKHLMLQKSWSENTNKKYGILKNILPELGINNAAQINESVLDRFVSLEIEKGHKNPTIAKNLGVLKVFIKYCEKHNLTNYDCKDYKPRLIWSEGNKKAIVYLEKAELSALMSAENLSPSLSSTRDVFVFCCFCGLRFSDVMALKKSDIADGRINAVTIKTSDDLYIELNKWTESLFAKYKDTPGDYLFPKITNQVLNRELKIIFRKLNLDRLVKKVSFSGSRRIEVIEPLYDAISSHAARRTFVVQALRLGVPAEVVMKWTGHVDYEAMRPYIDIVSDLTAENMKKFDNL